MNITLYDISNDYLQALDCFTDPDNDLPQDAVNDTLEGIEGQLQDKAINIAKYLRNLESTAKAIKEAEQQMNTRRKTMENRARWLKDYLKTNMEKAGISRIDSPWFNLSVQRNPEAVEVFDENRIPDKFKEEQFVVRVDKNRIKKVLQSGIEVPGACLSQSTRLAIR